MLEVEHADITSVLEIPKSAANVVSDRKIDFPRNLVCTLADFYGRYLSRDLHIHIKLLYAIVIHTTMRGVILRYPIRWFIRRVFVSANM